jgi:SAM-dependent MidA family methyltransferase
MRPQPTFPALWRPRSRGDPLVEAELHRRIRTAGRITFAEFMDVALYLPGGGYYDRHALIGRQGDFLTSPETHPIFGALLATLLAAVWKAIGSPPLFHVTEYGGGTGALCRDVMQAGPHISADFARAIVYQMVETSESLRRLQQTSLGDLGERVHWLTPGQAPTPLPGCIVANELVDALPVHRLRKYSGTAREVYVGSSADRYLELVGIPSCSELERYLLRAGASLSEGATVEVNLAAREWLAEAARRLQTGYLLIVDFGGSTDELCRTAGTRGNLKCCYRHGWTDDPYDRPGLQDITAPVDFTELGLAGEELGLHTLLYLSQRELLERLGLGRVIESMARSDLGVEERERNLQAMRALADPGGLGGYRVLLLGEAAPPLSLDALPEIEARVPLLPEATVTWPQ